MRPSRDAVAECRDAAGGHGAKLHWRDRGAIAQLGERLDRTQEVAGSSPASSINKRPANRALAAPDAAIPADLLSVYQPNPTEVLVSTAVQTAVDVGSFHVEISD
jgi:hypothetical protein